MKKSFFGRMATVRAGMHAYVWGDEVWEVKGRKSVGMACRGGRFGGERGHGCMGIEEVWPLGPRMRMQGAVRGSVWACGKVWALGRSNQHECGAFRTAFHACRVAHTSLPPSLCTPPPPLLQAAAALAGAVAVAMAAPSAALADSPTAWQWGFQDTATSTGQVTACNRK